MTTKELTLNTSRPGLLDGWRTEKEFAKAMKKSPRTIQRWRQLGKGPKFKKTPGGEYIIHDDVAVEWLHNLEEVG